MRYSSFIPGPAVEPCEPPAPLLVEGVFLFPAAPTLGLLGLSVLPVREVLGRFIWALIESGVGIGVGRFDVILLPGPWIGSAKNLFDVRSGFEDGCVGFTGLTTLTVVAGLAIGTDLGGGRPGKVAIFFMLDNDPAIEIHTKNLSVIPHKEIMELLYSC